MDDDSGKCLLDVISDPSALSEFLKSNSQILVDGEEFNSSKSLIQGASFLSQRFQTQSSATLTGVLPNNLKSHYSNSSRPDLVNHKSSSTLINSNAQSPIRSTSNSIEMSNVKRTFSHMTKTSSNNSTVLNTSVSPMPIGSVAKVMTTSSGNFQSKKPIPIQPKNQANLPITTPPKMNMHRHGLTPPSVLSRGHTPVSVNGVDTAKSRVSQLQTVQTNRTLVSPVTQSHLTTPPKRIAPKQILSPPTTPALAIPSPMRLQQSAIHNKQKIQIPAHLLQGQTIQGNSQSQPQLYPQQLTNVVRQVTTNTPTTIMQSSQAKPVQHVQQIQQLVHEKLGGQQPLQQPINQIQQKILNQSQLQAALKQTQLLAQNSPGQQQNLLVQQQILKQLIQQAQVQKQPSVVTTQSGIVQQLQTQQLGQSINQIRQSPNVAQQVTVGNQIGVNNQQIRMVLPNQQIVSVAPNSLPSNQQTLNVGQSVKTVSQQSMNTVLRNKQPVVVGGNQGNTQHMIIVSQGNFVSQQNLLQSKNTGITTTAGTPVSIQLQNLVNQQQKQLQQILGQPGTQTQQVKLINSVQQGSQTKINQPTGTVFLQNRVGTPGQVVKVQQGVPQSGVSQQNLILQSKQPLTSTTQGNMVQQLTQAQLQQLQNLGAVQKVIIIKQPEVLQKLGIQGGKQPQTIQITQQQLQVLQQMQSQQQAGQGQQKIIIQNKPIGGGNTTTTVLSPQQVKQLHTLQQQAGNLKVGQSPQTLLQRQALAQQLQKQLTQQQAIKTQAKMPHVPRILQTSGRQPVVTSQLVSKTTTTIKQEPNRGVKRSHPETPEPPKVVTRLKGALYQDQQGALHPDIHTPFKSRADAFNKLRRYHVYYDPGPTESDIKETEATFNTVSTQLIKKSEKMMEKYRTLILDESMRKQPSSEMVMLYRLYLADERAALAQNKKQITDDLKALQTAVKEATPVVTKQIPTSSQTIETTTVTAQISPQAPAAESKTPAVAVERVVTAEKDTSIFSSTTLIDTPGLSHCDEDEDSVVDLEESEIDKAVFNMESSSSLYFDPPAKRTSESFMADNGVDSPRTSVENYDADESIEDMIVDDEKEDVTATLALLHSMAEELDEDIS